MSFFPRALVGSDLNNGSFTPLFRLLDDFDTYSRGGQHSHRSHITKTFAPKFDIKEESGAYVLEGEFPGIEQKDVQIEFTDPQTLTVHGRVERQYTAGTPPAGVEAPETGGTITEAGEEHASHKATVEDEDAANNAATTANNSVANTSQQSEKQEQAPSQSKYWVSERSVGEFQRSFSFPDRVDQEAVTASMKNGILSIVVPKAKKYESRKITIN